MLQVQVESQVLALKSRVKSKSFALKSQASPSPELFVSSPNQVLSILFRVPTKSLPFLSSPNQVLTFSFESKTSHIKAINLLLYLKISINHEHFSKFAFIIKQVQSNKADTVLLLQNIPLCSSIEPFRSCKKVMDHLDTGSDTNSMYPLSKQAGSIITMVKCQHSHCEFKSGLGEESNIVLL